MRSFETPVFAHWHTHVENFQASPLEFHEAVEASVRKREIPELRFSRVEYHESGVLSATALARAIPHNDPSVDSGSLHAHTRVSTVSLKS
jgi:hypothetical protein